LKTPASRFSVDREHFENGTFQKSKTNKQTNKKTKTKTKQ